MALREAMAIQREIVSGPANIQEAMAIQKKIRKLSPTLTGQEILEIAREKGGQAAWSYFKPLVIPQQVYAASPEQITIVARQAAQYRRGQTQEFLQQVYAPIQMVAYDVGTRVQEYGYDFGMRLQGYKAMTGKEIVAFAGLEGGVIGGMIYGEQVKPTEMYYVKFGEFKASLKQFKMLSGQTRLIASIYSKYHPEAGLSEQEAARMVLGQTKLIASIQEKYPTVTQPQAPLTQPVSYRVYYYLPGETAEPDVYPSIGVEPSTIPKETWEQISWSIPKDAVVYRIETSDMPALDVSQLFKPKGMVAEEIMQTAYREGGIFAAGAFQMQLKPEVRYAITPSKVASISREYGSAMKTYNEQLAKWQAEVWKQWKPERQPAQTWGEWLGRAFETKLYFPSPVEQLTITSVIGGKKDTYTQRMISRIEELQHGIREMPIGQEPTIMFKEGRVIYEQPSERLAKSLEPLYLPVGIVRELEATAGFEPSPFGAVTQTLISQVSPLWGGKPTTEPLTQYWQTTKEHPGLLAGQVIGEILLAKYVWGPATQKALAGTKAVGSKLATAVKTFEVPLWMKKVPEAIYYETGLASKVAAFRSQASYLASEVGRQVGYATYVGKEALVESPLGAFRYLPAAIRYYAPELAQRISTTTPIMAAKYGYLRGKEYLAASKVVLQTMIPRDLTLRAQLSTPYMAARYWKEYAIPEAISSLKLGVKLSTPYMATKYEYLKGKETLAGLTALWQTRTPLSLRVQTSMPYMAAKYWKEYAIPELAYYPSEFLKRAGYEAKWYATQLGLGAKYVGAEATTYLERKATQLKYFIGDVWTPAKEQLAVAKWYVSEFGKRGLYEAKYYLAEEIPTYLQRIPTKIEAMFHLEESIARLKLESYYMKELFKRGGYELTFPLRYQAQLLKTKWAGIKFYLEHELYKTPHGVEHLLKEPYKGLQPTLGISGLPYRGFMGEIPRGVAVHRMGEGMALLTKQVTEETVKKTPSIIGAIAPLAAPFALQLIKPKPTVKEVKVPHLVKYVGPQFPSIYETKTKWHQISSIKLKPYPTEKPKTKMKELAAPVGLLKAWELERLLQPQRMKQPSLPKQLQMIRQIPKQIQIQVQELLPLQVETKKKKELIVPLLKPFAFEVSKQPLKLPQTPQITPQVAEIQMPQLKQIQIQIQEQITPPIIPPFEQFELPRRRKRKPKDLFGEWFKRTHPIKTPREMMFTFGFGSARRRRR